MLLHSSFSLGYILYAISTLPLLSAAPIKVPFGTGTFVRVTTGENLSPAVMVPAAVMVKPKPSAEVSRFYAYCATYMLFTATTQTMTYAGKPATEKVNYNAAQTEVYPATVNVIGTGGFTTYNFSSKDRVVMSSAAKCSYLRN